MALFDVKTNIKILEAVFYIYTTYSNEWIENRATPKVTIVSKIHQKHKNQPKKTLLACDRL